MTGGRILKLQKHLKRFERILVTYGDGLSNINLKKLIKTHRINKGLPR